MLDIVELWGTINKKGVGIVAVWDTHRSCLTTSLPKSVDITIVYGCDVEEPVFTSTWQWCLETMRKTEMWRRVSVPLQVCLCGNCGFDSPVQLSLCWVCGSAEALRECQSGLQDKIHVCVQTLGGCLASPGVVATSCMTKFQSRGWRSVLNHAEFWLWRQWQRKLCFNCSEGHCLKSLVSFPHFIPFFLQLYTFLYICI